MARLSPAFCRTLLPGCSTVPLALLVRFFTRRSSIPTQPWLLARSVVSLWVKSSRLRVCRALSAAIWVMVRRTLILSNIAENFGLPWRECGRSALHDQRPISPMSHPLSEPAAVTKGRHRRSALPMDHRAGQGAGDAVHQLDAGGHQPAKLIQAGRLDPGDDVVGAGEVLGQLHTIQVAERPGDMGDLADLGLDEHVRAQHAALTSSASDCATSWPDGWFPMGGGRMLHMVELAKEG